MHYLKEYQTPIGVLCIVSNSNAVTHLLPRHLQHAFPPDCVQLETDAIQQAAQQLQQYFAGERTAFDFPMQPGGTDFQLRVWQALKRIPYGQTRTYGQIATALGNPKGGRSIGSANNKNPIMIAIPCHRVIGANGALVGYAGGLEQKEYLLTLEQKRKGVAAI